MYISTHNVYRYNMIKVFLWKYLSLRANLCSGQNVNVQFNVRNLSDKFCFIKNSQCIRVLMPHVNVIQSQTLNKIWMNMIHLWQSDIMWLKMTFSLWCKHLYRWQIQQLESVHLLTTSNIPLKAFQRLHTTNLFLEDLEGNKRFIELWNIQVD